MRAQRSILLLAAAASTRDRDALLARVEKDIEVIAKPLGAYRKPLTFPFFDGWPEYLRAQVAAARDDRDRAFALLERAQAIADRDSLLAIYVQKRRGAVQGGTEGPRILACRNNLRAGSEPTHSSATRGPGALIRVRRVPRCL